VNALNVPFREPALENVNKCLSEEAIFGPFYHHHHHQLVKAQEKRGRRKGAVMS
jgi:hypothetical protein